MIALRSRSSKAIEEVSDSLARRASERRKKHKFRFLFSLPSLLQLSPSFSPSLARSEARRILSASTHATSFPNRNARNAIFSLLETKTNLAAERLSTIPMAQGNVFKSSAAAKMAKALRKKKAAANKHGRGGMTTKRG